MRMTLTWVIPPRDPVLPSSWVTLALTGSDSMWLLQYRLFNIFNIKIGLGLSVIIQFGLFMIGRGCLSGVEEIEVFGLSVHERIISANFISSFIAQQSHHSPTYTYSALPFLITKILQYSIQMAEVFYQLQTQISSSLILETLQLKQYALFVCQQIPKIKRSYQQNLQRHLSAWMQMVGQSIKSTLSSKQANQIGPKLELIYTTAINQQQTVTQHIKHIGQLILKQNYCFLNQTDSASNDKALRYTQNNKNSSIGELARKDSQNSSHYNSRQQTIIKGRSISNGSQRRKLSKGSCFAVAKKIDYQTDNSVQTATANQTFCKQSTGQNIKKTKKKEENGFAYLQKCMSSTSPSNFMLGYMAKADFRRERRQSRGSSRSNDRIDQKSKSPVAIADKTVEDGKKIQLSSQGHRRNDSGIYGKMMVNFEEKVVLKLDQIMDKYSKIQQKLQEQSLSSTKKHTTNQPLYSELNTGETSKCSEAMASQNKVMIVERQVTKVSMDKQIGKQVPHPKTTATNLNKSVSTKNKIVRNTLQQTPAQEDSMETITLPNTSLKSLNLHDPKNNHPAMITLAKAQILQSKIVSKAPVDISLKSIDQQLIKKISDDHDYIVKQLVEFNKTTLNIILPISKKMLYIITNKYSAFCNQHRLEMNAQVRNILTEQVTNQTAELKDSLQKMEKILQLKCNEEKKQKLLLYICRFLQCYQSFNEQNKVLRQTTHAMGEQTARSKIKDIIGKLT